MMNFNSVDKIIQIALEEDIPWGDVTSDNLIPPSSESELAIFLKEDGVVAGLPVAERVFWTLDPELKWISIKTDGDYCEKNTVLAKVSGKSLSLLKAERVALNILQRLSGIATLTQKFVHAANKQTDSVRIVDTRKTTPGLRYLEKYAVRMGGGFNHRYCLSDSVLIKDNHLAILQRENISLEGALQKIKQTLPHTVKIEVEVDSIEQIKPVLEVGVDAILLDNMTPDEIRESISLINGRAEVEVSGGVSLKTVGDIAATGVGLISVGALTHSAVSLDISLDYLTA